MEHISFLLQKPSCDLKVPKELPLLFLVASSIWYIQTKAKQHMIKRQAKLMGKENFMSQFDYQHELAFGSIHDVPSSKSDKSSAKGSAAHGLHTDKGWPEESNGGWYSRKASYKEWY